MNRACSKKNIQAKKGKLGVLKEITIILSIDLEIKETLDPLRESGVLSFSILKLRRTSSGT